MVRWQSILVFYNPAVSVSSLSVLIPTQEDALSKATGRQLVMWYWYHTLVLLSISAFLSSLIFVSVSEFLHISYQSK